MALKNITSAYTVDILYTVDMVEMLTLLTLLTLFTLLKLLHTANTLACMTLYIVREGEGKGQATKLDEFSEKCQIRGGIIFNPKIYIADFGDFKQFFLA